MLQGLGCLLTLGLQGLKVEWCRVLRIEIKGYGSGLETSSDISPPT